MSGRFSALAADYFAYLAAHTAQEDPFLASLKREAEDAGIPAIWIAPEQASLMQILLRLCGARRVVEVGTLAGYSAIAMARALPADGRVDTIEIEGKHAAFAQRMVAASDVAGRVVVHHGDGLSVLRGMADGTADAVFIDADKENYNRYVDDGLRILRAGGLLLVDNAFAFGQLLDQAPQDPGVPHIRACNDKLAATRGLHGIIVPLGDGLWVAVKA